MSALEEFRPISGRPGYSVSNMGRILSESRLIKCGRGTRRKAEYISHGAPLADKKKPYLYFRFPDGNASVHRIVAKAFVQGYAPSLTVNHIDGNPTNNRADNLEWVTIGDNIRHSYITLGKGNPNQGKFGQANPGSKPVVATCLKTGARTRYECVLAAERAGFRSWYVSRVANGKKASYRGHAWEFEQEATR